MGLGEEKKIRIRRVRVSSFRKLLPYVKPYWKEALIAPLLMMMEVAMDLAQPQFVRRIVDIGIAQMQISVIIQTGPSRMFLNPLRAFREKIGMLSWSSASATVSVRGDT